MKVKEFFRAGIVKSIIFNYRYLPLKKAWKLPVILYPGTKVLPGNGKIHLPEKLKTGMIKIGRVETFHCIGLKTFLKVDGSLVFKGKASIGSGSRICVDKSGELSIGEDFRITGGASVFCRKKITFGRENLISWDTLFMDSDMHRIMDCNTQKLLNEDAPVLLGDHIWIGCSCTILKGVTLADNTVLAAGTLLSKSAVSPDCIIGGGAGQKILKKDILWQA